MGDEDFPSQPNEVQDPRPPGWDDRDSWFEAESSSRQPDHDHGQTWQVCQDAGYTAIEFPEADLPAGELREAIAAGARRACLCFTQQMLGADPRLVPRSSSRILRGVLQAAGVRGRRASRESLNRRSQRSVRDPPTE